MLEDKLDEDFYQAVNEWRDYCNRPEITSSITDMKYAGSPAYYRIISMGKGILPLIRRKLDDKEGIDYATIGWMKIIRKLTNDEYPIPFHLIGDDDKIIMHAKKWLDENLERYIKA